jgi:N-acetylglucosaminyl-diphospho-decaprenol L-rhamnosyltransferase
MSDQHSVAKVVVGVAIVNYKTAQLVQDCLASLRADEDETLQYRVVVVDNASGDGSFESIRDYVHQSHMDPWVEVIAADKNGGFSYGNNIALIRLQTLPCQYYWLLNPDTQVRPKAAKKLVECFARYPQLGAVGSRLEDDDGTFQVCAFNFPSPMSELIETCQLGFVQRLFPQWVVPRLAADQAESVDWISGASFMVSSQVLEKVGLMDEGYFLYFEEVDYCIAIRKAGFDIMTEPASRVFHHVGAATGISDTRKKAPRRPKYWFESRQRFFQKNYGFGSTILADVLWMLAFSSLRIRSFIQRKIMLDPPHLLRDFFSHSSFVKGHIPVKGQVAR